MSENAQTSAAQNPAAKPSEADTISDSSWQSDFDAVNGIQFYLSCINAAYPDIGWSDEIDSDLTTLSNFCQVIAEMGPLCDPYTSLSSSDAVKLIAGIAGQLQALYPQPIPESPQDLIAANSNYIISACKDIDPSSAS